MKWPAGWGKKNRRNVCKETMPLVIFSAVIVYFLDEWRRLTACEHQWGYPLGHGGHRAMTPSLVMLQLKMTESRSLAAVNRIVGSLGNTVSFQVRWRCTLSRFSVEKLAYSDGYTEQPPIVSFWENYVAKCSLLSFGQIYGIRFAVQLAVHQR